MSTELRTRAWVDVDASALRANYKRIQDAVGEGVRILPMVKANAYGLGVGQTISALEPLGPWGYGVAAVEEGLHLRDLGISKPVLVCTPIPPGSYGPAVEGDLTISISDLGALRLLREAASYVGKEGRFHLEVDTGMGRAGLDWRRVEEWGAELAPLLGPRLSWDGCFTHFHSADGPDEGPTAAQWERLQHALKRLRPGIGRVMVHACNSPGALRRPDFGGDAVRPGIFLYGGVAGEGLPPPVPVAALRARVVLLRTALPGTTVGYGATYAAKGEERWATVGVGYGDGLPRLLGNRGRGLVRGKRVPIIGRISMDVTVVNVTDVPDVAVGDVVTLFGRDGDEEIRVEEVATQAQTINYEILTDLTPRVPRIWTDDGGY